MHQTIQTAHPCKYGAINNYLELELDAEEQEERETLDMDITRDQL